MPDGKHTDDVRSGDAPTAPDVHVKSDDPIVRVLRAVEKIQEQTDGKLAKIDERLAGFEESWNDGVARIRALEDKVANPTRAYIPASRSVDPRAHRRAAEYLVDFYKYTATALRDSMEGMQWRANQTSGGADNTGFLVPTDVFGEVSRIIEEHGVARQIGRVIPMGRDKVDVGRIASGPTVAWQTSDGSTGSNSTVTFGKATLDSSTLLVLNEVALQVNDDSAVDLAQVIIDQFAQAVAREEDKQAFNSTSPFTGVLQTSGVGTHTMATNSWTGNITYDDIRKTMFAANPFVIRRGLWLMSTDVQSEILGIKDSNGRPIFSDATPPGNGVAPVFGNIFGRPVVLSDVMPKAADDGADKPVLAYGDFQHLFVGDRRQLSFEWNDSVGFKEATRWLRVMERVAFVVTVPAAFAVLKTAS